LKSYLANQFVIVVKAVIILIKSHIISTKFILQLRATPSRILLVIVTFFNSLNAINFE